MLQNRSIVIYPPLAPDEPVLQMQEGNAGLAAGEFESVGHAVQFKCALAPNAAEYLPVTQSLHVAVPEDTLYFPATQSVQGPPSGPVEPMLHVQAFNIWLPMGESECFGHSKHSL
jgi:hypothetical protein